jgi:hypothetical protein
MYDYQVWDARHHELPIGITGPQETGQLLENPGEADGGHMLAIGNSDDLAYAILGAPADLFAFRDQLDGALRRAFPGGPVTLPAGERSYEGHVTAADGTRTSLQCWEGRHGECPDVTTADHDGDNGDGPLDGYYCECLRCGCGTGSR